MFFLIVFMTVGMVLTMGSPEAAYNLAMNDLGWLGRVRELNTTSLDVKWDDSDVSDVVSNESVPNRVIRYASGTAQTTPA